MTLNETIAMVKCMEDVLDTLDELYCKYGETVERYNDCPTIVSDYTNRQVYIKHLMSYIENTNFTVNDGITY